jgi:hypothetical protein
MTNYQSAVERIQKTNDLQSLVKLGKSFDNIYSYGLLTAKELQKLDNKIMDKMEGLKVTP